MFSSKRTLSISGVPTDSKTNSQIHKMKALTLRHPVWFVSAETVTKPYKNGINADCYNDSSEFQKVNGIYRAIGTHLTTTLIPELLKHS